MCINCPVTQSAAQTCWTLPIVLKQVLFIATAAQLCFWVVSWWLVGKSQEQLQPPREWSPVPCAFVALPSVGLKQRPLKKWQSWVSSPFYGDLLRISLISSCMKNFQAGSGYGTRMDISWLWKAEHEIGGIFGAVVGPRCPHYCREGHLLLEPVFRGPHSPAAGDGLMKGWLALCPYSAQFREVRTHLVLAFKALTLPREKSDLIQHLWGSCSCQEPYSFCGGKLVLAWGSF